MRSRLNWLKERDTNTSYFQHHVRYIKEKNFITKIKVADKVLMNQEESAWDDMTTGIYSGPASFSHANY
jgi:hypothetical protein